MFVSKVSAGYWPVQHGLTWDVSIVTAGAVQGARQSKHMMAPETQSWNCSLPFVHILLAKERHTQSKFKEWGHGIHVFRGTTSYLALWLQVRVAMPSIRQSTTLDFSHLENQSAGISTYTSLNIDCYIFLLCIKKNINENKFMH